MLTALSCSHGPKLKIPVRNSAEAPLCNIYCVLRTTVVNSDVLLLYLSFFALVIFPTILILWALEIGPFFFKPPSFEGGSVKSIRRAVYEVLLYNYLSFFYCSLVKNALGSEVMEKMLKICFHRISVLLRIAKHNILLYNFQVMIHNTVNFRSEQRHCDWSQLPKGPLNWVAGHFCAKSLSSWGFHLHVFIFIFNFFRS